MLTFRDALAEHKLEALAAFLPMKTFIQVNINPHSVSCFFTISSLSSLRLFCFSIIYSTEFKMKIFTAVTGMCDWAQCFSLMSMEVEIHFSRWNRRNHFRKCDRNIKKKKHCLWYVKTIKQTSWVDFQELCLTPSMRDLEQNKCASDTAAVLQQKDFPCAASKCGHESNNLYEKGHTVGRPCRNRIQVKQSLFLTLQQQNSMTSTVHCISRLFITWAD